MRTQASLAAVAAIAAIGLAAPAGAAPIVETFTLAVESFSSSTVTFGFVFGRPIAVSGPAQISLSIGGAYGDGARDGASLTPFGGSSIASVDLGGGTVATAGGAQSFAGAGGTAGVVQLSTLAVSTTTPAPTTFGFVFGEPIAAVGNRTTSQGAAAGAVLDGGVDGGTLTGAVAGTSIVEFRAASGLNPVPGAFAIGGPTVAAGSTFAAAGSDIFECTSGAPCDFLFSETSFQLTGDSDVAGLVLRQELGGDEIAGTVVDSYDIETGNGLFDCGVGCSLLTLSVNFTLTGFDAAALVLRVEIDSATAVPEPASLALFGMGFAALGLARRRRA